MIIASPYAMGRHILVADDRLDELKILVEILKRHRCQVSIAFNGKQACERARLRQPDLILLDINMPIINGLLVAKMLQNDRQTANIPIIFLTAQSDLDSRMAGLTSGAIDYIIKPFEAVEVMARINIALKNSALNPAAVLEISHTDDVQSEDARLVSQARRHVRQDMRKPYRIDILAKILGTHEKRLNHAFKCITGQTPAVNLLDMRLDLAKEKIRTTCVSISAIAEEYGFSDGANFATAFRHKEGIPPSEYRKQSEDQRKGGAAADVVKELDLRP